MSSQQELPATDPTAGQRGKATVAIIAIIVLIAAGLAVYFLVLNKGGGQTAALITAHIPAEAEYVGGMDVATMLKSDFANTMSEASGVSVEDMRKQLAEAGIKLEDLKSLAFGASGIGAGKPEIVTVASGTFDAKTIESALKMFSEKAAAGGAEMGLMGAPSFKVLGPGLVVGGSGELYTKSLTLSSGGGSSADSRDEIKRLRSHIDDGATFWMVGPIPEGVPMGGAMGGMAMLGDDIGQPTHFGLSAGVGSNLDVNVAILFSKGDAGALASKLEGFMGLAKLAAEGPQAKVLDSISLSGSGSILTASFELSPEIMKQFAQQKGGGGGLF